MNSTIDAVIKIMLVYCTVPDSGSVLAGVVETAVVTVVSGVVSTGTGVSVTVTLTVGVMVLLLPLVGLVRGVPVTVV